MNKQWPWWRLMLLVLNIAALILSVMLSWHYLKGGSMMGCDGTGACQQVLGSRWSMIAESLPVSGLAMGVYLAMLIAGFYAGPATEAPMRRMARAIMLIMAGSITGAAVWFIIVQKWIIGEFCPYCVTEHLIGVLMSAIIIWRALLEPGDHYGNKQPANYQSVKNSPPAGTPYISRLLPVTALFAGGLMVAGILAASQVIIKPHAAYHEGKASDTLPAITYQNVPMVGQSNAPCVIKLLFDYECPHCQKLHFMLNDVVNRYGGKVAFVLCPTPLNSRCNPYIHRDADAFKNSCELANIGLAVWVAKREAFAAFDNWMFAFEAGDQWHPRTPQAARAKAVELVGQAKFNAAQSSPWIAQYMQTCVQIYGETLQNGRGGVPKLIFGSHWVIPELDNTNGLIIILQKSLGLPRP